jgi:hypothetical protein
MALRFSSQKENQNKAINERILIMRDFLNECFELLSENDEEWNEILSDRATKVDLLEITENLTRDMVLGSVELLAEHALLLLGAEDDTMDDDEDDGEPEGEPEEE